MERTESRIFLLYRCLQLSSKIFQCSTLLLQHTEGGKRDHEGGEGCRADQADLHLDRHPACHWFRPRPRPPGVHRGHARRPLRHELEGDGARDRHGGDRLRARTQHPPLGQECHWLGEAGHGAEVLLHSKYFLCVNRCFQQCQLLQQWASPVGRRTWTPPGWKWS